MTTAALPLQLALALDVVFDAPTAREYADVMRKLGALLIGDALLFDGGRVDRAVNASEVEYYRLKWGGVTVGTWYVIAAASLARIQREILARLMALGVKEARVSPYDVELLCDDPAEDENDFMLESMQYESCRQEALVTALPAFKTSTRREHGGEFISINGHINVDQRPFVDAVVLGSKHISRDLDTPQARKILDPFGYLELKRELAQHPGFLDLRQMCSCKAHQGNRWLPKTEFSGGDVYCKWCRAEMTHQRYVASSQQPGAPSKRKYQSRTQARPRTYNRRTSSMMN